MKGKTFIVTLEGENEFINPFPTKMKFSSVEIQVTGDISYKGLDEGDVAIEKNGGTVEAPLVWTMEGETSDSFPFLLAGAQGTVLYFTIIR